MAVDSVGQIGLDLVVNKGSFEKQMVGIQGLAKKAGAALAAAFAVKKVVDFSAQCIKLGSDLAEVQNVVDVTFPRMKKQVDSFAQNAASSFGLSETMAKRFTGTFGAMAKAFGFNEKAAYDMSTTLTGLAGDVASFYNISQDEAYTKLKSVFTGETETLKDLGIVMTQNALDAYAMANGYGKTTQAMSEAEKVALRYKFVQDQLSLAAGDFSRTSGSWANQVRLLQLQFESLKATIGQGLIAALTPVIRVINAVIGRLLSLANAVKAVFSLFGGGGTQTDGAKAQAAAMDTMAASADNASKAIGGTGGAAKKAAKEAQGAATGIDELNILKAPSDGGSGGSGGAGDGYNVEEFDVGELEKGTDAIDERLAKLLDRFKQLQSLFVSGFKIGFGDLSVLGSIQGHLENIKACLLDIVSDQAVMQAGNRFLDAFAFGVGQSAGSLASIGATLADNLLGGIDLCLAGNSQRIKDFFVSMFDIGGEISGIIGQLNTSIADIFSVFRSDNAKQITADLIGIFVNAFMGVAELAGGFTRDIIDLIATPIIDNSGKIKTALEGIQGVVQKFTSTCSDNFSRFFDKILKFYNESVSPMIDSFKTGLSDIVGVVLDGFNTHIVPVLDHAADRFQAFCENTLQPLIDKFLEFAGKVTECITVLWESVLKPFIEWFIETIYPYIADALRDAVDSFFDFLESVGKILGHVIDALSAFMDFLVGVFTGNWEMAWEGIRAFFAAIWEAIKATLEALFGDMYRSILQYLANVKAEWEAKWNAIKQFFAAIWTSIKDTVSRLIDNIQLKISTTMTTIKTGISSALETIKKTWTNIWEGLKKTTLDIFDGIWKGIKGVINSILSGIETMVNGVVRGINRMIDALNSISFDIPDWVPGIGGESFGLNIPTISTVSLPRLAQGGFVKANTPQLAMIGDNRHYGEIVAPEDKMQEMVNRAVAMASQNSGMSDQYLAAMVELLKKIIDLIETMDLTVNIDIREIKKKLTDLDKRTGYTLRTT